MTLCGSVNAVDYVKWGRCIPSADNYNVKYRGQCNVLRSVECQVQSALSTYEDNSPCCLTTTIMSTEDKTKMRDNVEFIRNVMY
jgi:hypothetical protein